MGLNTEVGRYRDHNEDSFNWYNPGNDTKTLQQKGCLYIIADGMGGYAAGEVASEIAVKTVVQEYAASYTTDIVTTLERAIQSANLEIYQQSLSDIHQGMGTTIVCAVIRGDELYVAHVGDSRAYLLSDNQLSLLTEDHTLVNELVKIGVLSLEEAKVDSRRHLISRALGKKAEVIPDIQGPSHLQTGDSLLLCTDGISEYMNDEQIAYVLQANQNDPQAAAVALTQFADAIGGDDNSTAIVVVMDKVIALK